MILPPFINLDKNPGGSKNHPCISPSTGCYTSLENKKWDHEIQFKKIITYKRKWLNEYTPKCSARLSMNCYTSFWWSSLRICVSTKSSIGLGSHLRAIACNKKILQVKYIKINLIIRFTCETNEIEPLVCVVTELWICWHRFTALECECRVKRSDITCIIYSAYIFFGMYGGLKSRLYLFVNHAQTASSF